MSGQRTIYVVDDVASARRSLRVLLESAGYLVNNRPSWVYRPAAIMCGSARSAERISLAAETRRQLYLIFKEAIRNALRHGRPRNVMMRLAVTDGRLAAEIRDDGAGIPPDHVSADVDESAGYGLGTMRRRAESLGGSFRVISEAGEGTRIVVEVPLLGGA